MQQSIRLVLSLAIITLLTGSASASPDAFRPVSRSSSISARSFEAMLSDPTGTTIHNKHSTTTLGLYDSTIIADSAETKAYQRSAISSHGVEVLLQAIAARPWSSLGYKTAESRFELVFDILNATSYHFSGSISVSDEAPPDYRQPFGQVMLKGPGIDIDLLAKADTPFDYTGQLNPGTYTLSMTAYAQEAWACSATTAGAFTLLPEPSGLAALSLSALLLCRRRSFPLAR